MARLAHGLADDTLTEAVLAHDGPILVAPAMNTRMWQHPATRANHELLLARGVEIVGPASGSSPRARSASAGWRAGGDRRAAEGLLRQSRTLEDKHVLVTAGGTREPIDSVRFVGNRSSGRMGSPSPTRHAGAAPG
jgi:phosphopantothenoylcysteine decarboxylase/phosphopantothenate--cysteine ligase